MSTGSGGCRACLVFALAWIAGVGALAYVSQPHLPLDMSPADPETVAAMREAMIRHWLAYTLVALAPPLAAWLVASATVARKR
jgi:hypothetical protein